MMSASDKSVGKENSMAKNNGTEAPDDDERSILELKAKIDEWAEKIRKTSSKYPTDGVGIKPHKPHSA